MTVCIAAVCDSGFGADARKIVLCTDNLVSSALGSSDTMLKTRIMGRSWVCLTAGDGTEILALAAIMGRKFRTAQASSISIDETNVGVMIREALADRKKQKIDEIIRGQYAISYDDLLKIGKDKFPPEIFRDAMLSVRDIQIDCDLIVAGFALGFPMLLQTDCHGRVAIHEEFAIVGEGAYLAQSALMQRAHNDQVALPRALYNVYEAKRYAEGARSVGHNTSMIVFHQDGKREFVQTNLADLLEQEYKKYGPKIVDHELALTPDMFANLG